MEQGNDKLELVYGVEDKPSPLKSAYAALQHLLAIIVGIIRRRSLSWELWDWVSASRI